MPRAGRVLLYAAEDALHIVRRRLDGICAAAGLGLADLDVQVITAPTVRLDLAAAAPMTARIATDQVEIRRSRSTGSSFLPSSPSTASSGLKRPSRKVAPRSGRQTART